MLLSVVLAVTVSGGICTVTETSSAILEEVSHQKEAVLYEKWQERFCRRYSKDYTTISYEVIAQKSNFNHTEHSEVLGDLSIGSIRAGRVKLEWNGKNTPEKSTIWLKVNAKKLAWVSNVSLASGISIREEHISKKLVNVASIEGIKKILTNSPVGSVLNTQARKGQLLTTDIVSLPPLVQRNKQVTILVSTGALHIKTKGVAKEFGWKKGDSIFVEAESSNGAVLAKVIGNNLVYVK
jgi:flagella basal body P-ring formation protein FlgA